MPLLVLLILALIQGVTEFLPISSSGHLSILYRLFRVEGDTLLLSIFLHLATLLAIVIYYRKDILILIRSPFCPTNRKIATTTIVTSILVLIFKPYIDKLFTTEYIFIFFIITAFALFISDYMSEKQYLSSRTHGETAETPILLKENITNLPINYKQAIVIGVTQAIATIPGISRSGSTIATASFLHIGDVRAKYSFLISIPIIILSLVYSLIEGGSMSGIPTSSLILAFILCFVTGLISIRFVERLSSKNKLSVFGYYLLILSLFLILNDAILNWF